LGIIANGRIAIAHRGPRDVADGRWSEGRAVGVSTVRILRREPLETRKATLASLLRSWGPGLRLVEHLAHGGDVVYCHACALGCEGIVSKRSARPTAPAG
jgi:hypothetical protein